VKFSDYQNKPKMYVCNRGCDVVTVLDPVSGLAMRYVDVGITREIEGPCMVAVAPDKQYWYVIFNQGTTLQKFRTSDNVKMGEVVLGPGFWTSVVLSVDSRKAFISDANFTGRILCLDLESMQVLETYATGLRYPYGLCLNRAGNRLYATSKEGNYIYKLDITNLTAPVISEVSLESGVAPNSSPSLNPYNILLSDDETSYYVICNRSSELRIMQTNNDSLLGNYATGSNPNELICYPLSPYLFISCLGVPGTNKVSEVSVFNLATRTFASPVQAGHDSKGMAIDIASGRLYISNRNVSEGGPAAHHAPVCNGKNGSITAVDLVTLQLIQGYKTELSVDPYFIGQ
jgi:DNA-binding beta-propeller fold protein YncE